MRNEDVSKELRKEFHKFVDTPRSVLVFANFYKYWSKENESPPETDAVETGEDFKALAVGKKRKKPRRKKKKVCGNLVFGRGMRSCLKRWYDSFSCDDLIETLYATPAVNGIKHTDIIRQIHLYCNKQNKKDDQASKKAKTWPKVEKPPPDPIKKLIVESSYWNAKQLKEKEAENKNVWLTGHKMRKVVFYRNLKQHTDIQVLSSTLNKGRQEFNYKLEHLPDAGFKSEALTKIIDGMPIKETIDAVATLHEKKVLTRKIPFLKTIKKNLSKTNSAIKAAQLNPLHVFDIKQKVEARYTKTYGAKHLEVVEEFKIAHASLLDKLMEMVDKSLSDQPKTGCRYFVTLDLRKFSKRRKNL